MTRLKLQFATLSLVAALICVSPASAGWGGSGGSWGGSGGSWGGSGGSWGGSGGCWGGSGGSWGGSGGSWGGSGGRWGGSGGSWGGSGGCWGGSGHRVGLFHRMAARIHSRHASRGGGSYGGFSSVGYGSTGVSYGSSGSSYASYGSTGSFAVPTVDAYGSDGTSYAWQVHESTPMGDCCGGTSEGTIIDGGMMESDPMMESAPMESTPMEANPMEEAVPTEARRQQETSAMLAIDVPADAAVFVNGHRTVSTGMSRKYRSAGLAQGRLYTYEIRAVMGDKAVTKFATVQAGQQANLTFDFAEETSPETILTLHVPADAKVTLAGAETKQAGTARVFSTNRLEPGQIWNDYAIVVTLEQDGRTITKERSLAVRGGESYELRIDFDDDQLAAR